MIIWCIAVKANAVGISQNEVPPAKTILSPTETVLKTHDVMKRLAKCLPV
jgi:hypothetical protein